jgi:hypothetical protein
MGSALVPAEDQLVRLLLVVLLEVVRRIERN